MAEILFARQDDVDASAALAASVAAAASEAAAAVSASTASTQATNAATSASNASTSETNAAASAVAAAASADGFDDVYLGSKAVNPTLDNDGNALVEGQLYWNNVSNELRVYDGAAWVAYSSSAGMANLVDDTSPQLGGNLDLNSFVITGMVIGTNIQAYDGDLAAIAAIAPSNDDVIQRKAGAWTNRTMAQVKTDLVLVKADVGLGNVDNTSDATKDAAVATLTNKTLTSPVINSPTGIIKGDVGLGNVDNTSDANKPVSTATQTALDLKQNLDATLTALAAYNTNGILTQTAADTFAGRTITGTANQITVSNGDGVAGNPTLSLPADVLIPTVLTVPNSGLHILDTNASHDLIITPGSDLTADRILTITTGDSARTVTISGNATISQDYSTTGNPQFATIELGAASDTTLARAAAGAATLEGIPVGLVKTTTLSSSGTPTINTGTSQLNFVNITALAAAITSMTTNLTGSPIAGDRLYFLIKDNGTARAITWGASFTAMGVALPTTTVISKFLTVGFIYNGTTWGCVASVQEA